MSNVVGDIAGNLKTLLALLKQMPDSQLISLGDLNDRGSESKEVINYVRDHGVCVQSNHGHMMVEEYKDTLNKTLPENRYYESGIWYVNGGNETVMNYGKSVLDIPYSHIEYLDNLPMYIKTDKFFYSHAPFHIKRTLSNIEDIGIGFVHGYFGDIMSDTSLLWNREVPRRPHPELDGLINVFGHNSSDAVKIYTEQYPNGKKCYNNDDFQEALAESKVMDCPIYGICLDVSGGKKLAGLDTNTMTLYLQDYI